MAGRGGRAHEVVTAQPGARRWPWALAATVAGAAAGAAVAYAVRRASGQDRPGAVEPEQLRAVVDRPDDEPA
jgi:hypothetical protein